MRDEYKEKILEKLLSGRFIMSVMFSSTYCLVIISAIVLTIMGIMKLPTLMALFVAFTSMVVLINEWYFKREDRKKEVPK